MKKLLLFLMLMAATSMLYAQTEAGKVMIGTSMDLYGSSMSNYCANSAGFSIISSKFKSDDFDSDASSATAFNLSPRIGYFVEDNIMLGGEFTFDFYKYEDADDPQTIFGVGPFGRYYFDFENFKPFAALGVNVGQVKYGEQKTNMFSYGAGVGGAFFVSDYVSIDLMAKFSHLSMKDKDAEGNARNVSNGFGIGVGLSVFL